MRQLLLIELNEVNFEFVQAYVTRGQLPNFAQLLRRHGFTRTTSEDRYEQIEPWIQWVTAHTGQSLAEHSVFRLGDIVSRDIPQIWEMLEERGLKVGAISPMNAKHRLRDPAFFVPDPWTQTGISAPWTLRRLYGALSQMVNDNASGGGFTPSAVLSLLQGAAWYARPANFLEYLGLAFGSLGKPWRRALFLDLLLADVFIREVGRTRPNFASLFLNAAAHIQHHYMFNAGAYQGTKRNPRWYVNEQADPVLESYQLYDRVIGTLSRRFPEARLMLATGLHQVPHEETTFYWRLKDHAAFLKSVGVPFSKVEPRMSRDFLITCDSPEMAQAASQRLSEAIAADGLPLFESDNRGNDVFVMLTYPKEINDGFVFNIGAEQFTGLKPQVEFVAIKNGQHSGIGYFLDTGLDTRVATSSVPAEFPLKEMPARIREALGLAHADMADQR